MQFPTEQLTLPNQLPHKMNGGLTWIRIQLQQQLLPLEQLHRKLQ